MDPIELLDPEYLFFKDEPSNSWTLDNLEDIRRRVAEGFKPRTEARCEQRWIGGASGTYPLRLCLYWPETAASHESIPAVLYMHGGGFVLGCPEMLDDYLVGLAADLNALIVAVDYRLAPEHPFPAPLEDCYTGLAWLIEHGEALGIDKRNIAIMGHSAGGGLAAALALLVRTRRTYAIAGMALIYPMLDHRTGQQGVLAENSTTGTFAWGRAANQFCWECYRGAYTIEGDSAGLFSPALATGLHDLPPCFVGVGSLDLFLEEDVAFALKLSNAAVPVELHVYPGVPHMFDQYPGTMTDQSYADTVRALRRMVARTGMTTASKA